MSDPLFTIIEKLDRIEKNIKPDFPNWMNCRELSDYLRVSESQIRKLVSSGDLPYRRVGQALRFNRRQIDLVILSGNLRPNKRTCATFEALID